MLTRTDKTGFFLKNNLILLVIVTFLFFLYTYNKTLFYRPSSIHQWRQTDCLSITKNYYEEGLSFFQPKIHFQGIKDGNAMSEFPILNYTVAVLWKIFGEHEFIYRLLEYVIFMFSIFILFNTLLQFLRSTFFSFFTVGFILTSPLITYYDLNFIADVPAFSLGLISFCLFFKFYNTKRMPLFYWALALGTLAVLMKASAIIALVLLIFFSMVDIFKLNSFFKTEKLFVKKIIPALSVVLSIGFIISWYKYALYYNNNNKNDIFLLTILPIWEMSSEELIHNSKILFNNYLLPWFLNKPMFFLFACLVIYVSVNFKKLNSFFKYAFAFSALYFVLYFVFFFQVFNLHDYYLINLMIFPVITCLCFSTLILPTEIIVTNHKFVWMLFICLFAFNAVNASAMYRLRMVQNDGLVKWYPFVSEDEENLANYLFWDYGNSIKRIENFTPELRKHGIKRKDIVLSIPDYSYNISLYFMDQKGYGITRQHFVEDSTILVRFLSKKIQYVIMSDTTLKREKAFKSMSAYFEPLFTKDNVEVFRFKSTL